MLSDLINEIEERIRQIVREEIDAALLESKNPHPKTGNASKVEKVNATEKKEFPELLTAPQAAELLGVSAARVYDLTRQRLKNGFPVILIGERSYRYSKQSMLKWIERDLK